MTNLNIEKRLRDIFGDKYDSLIKFFDDITERSSTIIMCDFTIAKLAYLYSEVTGNDISDKTVYIENYKQTHSVSLIAYSRSTYMEGSAIVKDIATRFINSNNIDGLIFKLDDELDAELESSIIVLLNDLFDDVGIPPDPRSTSMQILYGANIDHVTSADPTFPKTYDRYRIPSGNCGAEETVFISKIYPWAIRAKPSSETRGLVHLTPILLPHTTLNGITGRNISSSAMMAVLYHRALKDFHADCSKLKCRDWRTDNSILKFVLHPSEVGSIEKANVMVLEHRNNIKRDMNSIIELITFFENSFECEPYGKYNRPIVDMDARTLAYMYLNNYIMIDSADCSITPQLGILNAIVQECWSDIKTTMSYIDISYMTIRANSYVLNEFSNYLGENKVNNIPEIIHTVTRLYDNGIDVYDYSGCWTKHRFSSVFPPDTDSFMPMRGSKDMDKFLNLFSKATTPEPEPVKVEEPKPEPVKEPEVIEEPVVEEEPEPIVEEVKPEPIKEPVKEKVKVETKEPVEVDDSAELLVGNVNPFSSMELNKKKDSANKNNSTSSKFDDGRYSSINDLDEEELTPQQKRAQLCKLLNNIADE